MRSAAAVTMSRPGALRRGTSVLVIGGTAFLILFAMLFLGLSMKAISLGAALAGAAAATVLYPEVGLAAILINAIVGLAHLTELPKLGPISVPIAFEIVLALAFGVQVMLGRRRVFLSSPQHGLILALSFWIVVSFLVNGRVTEENLEVIRNGFIVRVLVFFLLTNILSTEASLRRLIGIFAVSNVGLIAASIATRLGAFGQEKVVVSEKMLRTSALVHNPNTLAFELTTMLILMVFTAFYVKSRPLKIGLVLLAAADGAVILSTLSRSGFISLLAVLVFMFFRLTRSARVVAVVLIAAVLGGLLSQTNLVKRFSRIDELKDVDRVRVGLVGMNAAAQNPIFGVGMGNFVPQFEKWDYVDFNHPLPTHDMYLDLASSTGVPGLLLYLGVIAFTWRRARRMERELRESGEERSFLAIYAVAVQCFLVNLCVFGLSGDVEFEYSVLAMLGFGILLWRLHETRRNEGAPA